MADARRAWLKRIAALAAAPADDPAGFERAFSSVKTGQWRRILEDAREHFLLPLILKNLRKAGLLGAVPSETRSRAEEEAAGMIACTSFLYRLGEGLIAAAADAGVTLVPVKGMHLIPLYYEPDERPMRDVDFLIRESDAGRVKELMESRGLRLETGRFSAAFMTRFMGEMEFSSADAAFPAMVEAQWDIAAPPYLKRGYGFDAGWVMDSAARGGRLTAEAAVVYAVFHLGAAHSFSRLMWLMDVHRLAVRGVGWDEVVDAAGRFGMRALAACALGFCEEFFGAPVPQEVYRGLGRRPSRLTERAVVECLMHRRGLAESRLVPFLLSGKKTAFLRAFVFPGAGFAALRYSAPPWKAFLLSLSRPFLLAARLAGFMKRGNRRGGA
ncbi:MAG: nucleotidyltransferase family protein [bacterium]